MFPIPVREDDALNLAKIGAEPRRVALEGEIFRAAVKQHAMPLIAARGSKQHGEAAYCTAKAAAGRGTQAPARREGKFVLDIGWRRRQSVGRVVDEDLNLDFIDRLQPGHTPYCGSMPESFTNSLASTRSVTISLANSSGELIAGTWPRVTTNLSTNSLSSKARLTSALSRSMIGFGVPEGANSPYQVCDGAPP